MFFHMSPLSFWRSPNTVWLSYPDPKEKSKKPLRSHVYPYQTALCHDIVGGGLVFEGGEGAGVFEGGAEGLLVGDRGEEVLPLLDERHLRVGGNCRALNSRRTWWELN